MPRPKGLPKTGGRTKGTPNFKTREFSALLESHNFCPASAMIDLYHRARKLFDSYDTIYEAIAKAKAENAGYPVPTEDKAHIYLKLAGDMAKELATYAYAKRKAIEQNVDEELLAKIKELDSKSDEELLAIVSNRQVS